MNFIQITIEILPYQITEYENKLSLGKAGPSNDARQQRAASYSRSNNLLC